MYTSEYISKLIAFKDQNPLDVALIVSMHHQYLEDKKPEETFDEYLDRQFELAVVQEAEDLQKNYEEASDVGYYGE